MRFLILCSCLIYSLHTRAQGVIWTGSTLFADSTHLFEEQNWVAYPVENAVTKNLELYLLNGRREIRLIFGDTFDTEPQQSQLFEISGRYDKVLGHLSTGDETVLFFIDKKAQVINYQIFGQDDKVPVQGMLEELDLSNETILSSFTKGGRFYLLTVPKRTSIIKNYAFSSHDNYRLTEYDLSGSDFEQSKETLHSILHSKKIGLYGNPDPKIGMVSGFITPSLYETSKAIKIYPLENEVLITFDHEYGKTTLLRVFLNSRFFELESFSYRPLSDFAYAFNSFLFNGMLFQLNATSKELDLTVARVADKETLSNFFVKRGDNIGFKNTPMFLQKISGTSGKRLEISETKQILKQLTKFEMGLSVRQVGDVYELKIGVYDEIHEKYNLQLAEYGMLFLGLSFSETLVNEYYFKSVLSTDLKEVPDETAKTDIQEQLETIVESNATAEFIESVNGRVIYGYFDREKRVYKMYELHDN